MAKVFGKSSLMRTIPLFFLVLSLTFCQKEAELPEISISFPSDPPSLDPLFATDLVSQKLSKFIFAGLYEFKGSKINRRLVVSEKFTTSEVENSLQLILDDHSKVRSSDVAFSLNRLIQNSSPRQGDYKFIHKTMIHDDKKLSIVIDKNISEMHVKEKLALPFASILRKDIFETTGKLESFGFYQLQEWKKNEYLKLNKRIETSNSFPKEILIRILPQSSTALFLYKKKQLDAFKLSDFLLTIPEADIKHTVVKKGRSIQYVAINQKNNCFDKNFRYALNFSIPRELIINKLLGGKADTTRGPIPLPFYNEVTENTKGIEYKNEFDYDLKKAKFHLERSICFPKILETPLEFRMRGDDENQAKGRAIVQALIELGLKINLKGMEKAPLYKENGEGKGDLTLLTWYADYPSIWNFLDPVFHEKKLGNGGNRSFYTNSNITSMLDQKRSIREAMDIVDTISNDAPWIFLWSIQENYLVSDKFILHEGLSDYL
ncbi:MAG: ABC transporter substrate-binding protein [Leptospira sp.]|nr:ABC transporter substrate-binding protein [Leptospira sp.]